MINAGSLNKKIVVTQLILVDDLMGGRAQSWETYCTTWGEVYSIKTSETMLNDNPSLLLTQKIRIRSTSKNEGILRGFKVKYDGKTQVVLSVENKTSELILTTKEVEL